MVQAARECMCCDLKFLIEWVILLHITKVDWDDGMLGMKNL